jgi:hypothetical protein
MGKASSSKKVARAARAAGRPGARRNYTWPAVIGIIVVLGIVLVVASRNSSDEASAGPPTITDHWHEAFGVDLCGKWQPDLAAQVHSGVHTHGDGLIHVEPTTHQETGKNANVGKFVKDFGNGLVITQSEIKLPGASKSFKDGGKCGSKKANVRIYFWKNITDKKPKVLTGALSSMHIENNSAIVFAFLPEGQTPSLPPSVQNLQNPNAAEGGGSTQTTGVTVPTSTPSTAPPEGSSSSSSSSSTPSSTP